MAGHSSCSSTCGFVLLTLASRSFKEFANNVKRLKHFFLFTCYYRFEILLWNKLDLRIAWFFLRGICIGEEKQE